MQMPLNVMDAHSRSFGQKVLPVLMKEGIGVLGMKSMGDGFILKSSRFFARNLAGSICEISLLPWVYEQISRAGCKESGSKLQRIGE
jgi:hypothetical protein